MKQSTKNGMDDLMGNGSPSANRRHRFLPRTIRRELPLGKTTDDPDLKGFQLFTAEMLRTGGSAAHGVSSTRLVTPLLYDLERDIRGQLYLVRDGVDKHPTIGIIDIPWPTSLRRDDMKKYARWTTILARQVLSGENVVTEVTESTDGRYIRLRIAAAVPQPTPPATEPEPALLAGKLP